ncbi:hypothetical protein [Aurantiacibacter sediminis]|uniref:Uncharacterized protein n=1 Tax=Aurantiacibacter sediminis TaxID=2793064 RepID=A0ABS0N5L2_9SPHN|nr:hypothetical protein [Aurantiacibacter sediminis]MBH5323085.1 hypothetical protein [Aurantiacibacter sediminis]
MAKTPSTPKWYHIPITLAVTEAEYHANIRGLNVVFGAVLGFVLADSRSLENYDFALLLLMSATLVVIILYLGSSVYKLFYGLMAIGLVAALPELLEMAQIAVPPKLQPTLAVWTAMVIVLELLPRFKPASEASEG